MPEKNVESLLSSMNPQLHNDEFVFCRISESELKSLDITPLCVFREDEGISLIAKKRDADLKSIEYSGTWSLITCKVNSDLTAVGFLAAMSKILADAGIAVNAVSAYLHDHLFVPSDRAREALDLLRRLANQPIQTELRKDLP